MNGAPSNPSHAVARWALGTAWPLRENAPRPARAHHRAVKTFCSRYPKGIPISIDHMGRVDFSLGLDQPAVRWILRMLERDNWWMMVSNGNRTSAFDSGWDDAVPFGRAYLGAAPDRTIWATDWPHVRWRKKRMMNDAEEVELLYRYADYDAALLRKVLVDNPARLHGFDGH